MVLNQHPILLGKLDWMLGILRQVAAHAQQLDVPSFVSTTFRQRHDVIDVIFAFDARPTKRMGAPSPLPCEKGHNIAFGNGIVCRLDAGTSSRLMEAVLSEVLLSITLLLRTNFLRVRSHPFSMSFPLSLLIGAVVCEASSAFRFFVFLVSLVVLCLCLIGMFLAPSLGPVSFVCQSSGSLRVVGLIGYFCSGHPRTCWSVLSEPQARRRETLGTME